MSVGDTAVSERMIQREHSLIRKKVSMWFSFCLYFKKSQLMFYDSGPSCVHACVRARVYVLCNNPPEHIWASIWNETMLPEVLWHPFFLECPLMSNQGSQETAGGPPQCRPVDRGRAACSLEGGPALSAVPSGVQRELQLLPPRLEKSTFRIQSQMEVSRYSKIHGPIWPVYSSFPPKFFYLPGECSHLLSPEIL